MCLVLMWQIAWDLSNMWKWFKLPFLRKNCIWKRGGRCCGRRRNLRYYSGLMFWINLYLLLILMYLSIDIETGPWTYYKRITGKVPVNSYNNLFDFWKFVKQDDDHWCYTLQLQMEIMVRANIEGHSTSVGSGWATS